MKAEEFQWIRKGADGGVAFWQAYDPSVKADLCCCAYRIGDTLILIDPIPLGEPALAELTADAAPIAVVLTSANHQRAASWFAERFSIPVFAHDDALPELSIKVDAALMEGTTLLQALTVVELPGAAPGEVALYGAQGGGVLIVGDALINLEATGFAFLPDKYCTDPRQLRQSVQKLASLPVELIAFAHGLPLVSRARERLDALISEVPGLV